MGSRDAAVELYQRYIDLRSNGDTPDELTEDARARIGQ